MSDSIALAIKPIVRYPRVAQVGKTYLMTIDLEVEPGSEWQYDEEEYPVYCEVESELFKTQIVGEPVIMLHCFGGSYGEAKFLLKTISKEQERGKISISLTNKWGLGFKIFELEGIQVKLNTKLTEQLNVNQDILFEESDLLSTENIEQEAINPLSKNLGKLYELIQGKSKKFEYQYLKYQVSACQGFKTEGFNNKTGIIIPLLEEVFLPLYLSPSSSMSILSMEELLLKNGTNNTCEIWDFLRNRRNNTTSKQIIILAWGGYGKTTLLNHLTYTYATNQFSRFNVPKLIPILLTLRRYSYLLLQNQSLSLPDLINRYYIRDLAGGSDLQAPVHWFRDLLMRGNALVMLDGFDEVPKSQRTMVANWINQQIHQYNKSVFIVTSRPSAYRDQETVRQLQIGTVLWVEALNINQQQEFIRKWYQCQEIYLRGGRKTPDSQKIAEQKAANLISQIIERPELKVLVSSPLLLQMIVAYHRFTSSELPHRRVDLYQEICAFQLTNRPMARQLETQLIQCDAQTILQMVALEMMIQQKITISKMALLEKIAVSLRIQDETIDAHEFLNEVVQVSELLIEKDEGEYGFVHLSLQEYLAALQIFQHNQEQIIYEHVADEIWKQTILLYAALTNNPNNLIRCLLRHGVLDLAYSCLKEVRRSIDPDLLEELRQLRYKKLEELMKKNQWREAERETYELMIKVIGKEEGECFDQKDLENFPSNELYEIDKIWVKYSNGKWGFSIQRQIWKECGRPIEGDKSWEKFGDRVGWRKHGGWMDYSNLVFDLESSPKGNLPVIHISSGSLSLSTYGTFGHASLLFSREDW